MSRETRVNLIVLGVLLVMLAPGAVILFNKKFDPTARPMNRPDFVRRHLVFIDPTPAPAGVERLMPSLTAGWVGDLVRREMSVGMLARSASFGGDNDASTVSAVMSDRRLAQLAGLHEFADGCDLGLLVWNLPRGTKHAELHVMPTDDNAATNLTVEIKSSRLLTIPSAVKRDLQQSGMPAPPQQALWAIVRLNWTDTDARPRPASVALSITVDTHGVTLGDTLTSPTSADKTARTHSVSD